MLNNIGYGTETTPFRRGSAEEALEHMVTPYDNAAIFKDCVKDATLIRLFPKFFVQNSKGYKSVGMTATQELKNNPAYNQSMTKAVAQSETNFLKIA